MEDSGYTLYKHTTPAGKVYFGITGRSPEERWDRGNGYRNNKHFWSAIKKYGWPAIEHEVLLSGLTKSEAEELERELIEQAGSTDPRIGYNLDCGGSSVGKASDATREKMAEAARRHWKDPAYREKIVAALKERTFSQAHREKISRSRKGKKHSIETLQKISEHTRGKNAGAANPHARSVLCIETETIFETTRSAAESVGVTHSAISMACSGKRKTVGGYHWRYA